MTRATLHPRTPFAPELDRTFAPRPPRRIVARGAMTQVVRWAVVPLALVVAAAAGLLYLLLLPVCGIASIAGGLATGAWRRVRGSAQPGVRDSRSLY